MPSNTAAWQPKPGVPVEIKDTPYTSPSADYILIKNHAIAINPIDFKLQDMAMFPSLSYPTILGNDLAGEVVEVGSAVSSHFKPGDRVLAQAGGVSANSPSGSAFQEYTVVVGKMASHIPDSLSYVDAAVIPLGAGTASCGLFQKDQLALKYPSLSSKPTGQTVLIWSGATSVGLSAIQLAVAAGYEVIATASPKNFELVRSFGATEVLDYNVDSTTLVEQLATVFEDKTFAGVLHTAGEAADAVAICADLFPKINGNKFFTTTVQLPTSMPADMKYNRVFASAITNSGVGEAIFVNYLPQALAEGKYKSAPKAEVVGNGLESLQKGLDILRKGVSAKKLVVTLN
ncbi:oxidoreductase [Aureobasidium pullulans]|uniref:Oxidoreductase n=1 Tax=Aureobasidium pullulans TaxID=5580 RepID=A0A4S9XND8_AURPU|nr:oxidoreductase [Aureobasidium pullulans]